MDPLRPLDRAVFSPEKLAKTNLFESPRMFLDVYALEPGQSQRAHAHPDQDKVYLALSGNGSVQLGTRILPITAGEVTVAPAGVEHGVSADAGGRLVLLVMMTKRT
jgi:mannose-6-phosphate isomerase-like protein (cupin superfamily)